MSGERRENQNADCKKTADITGGNVLVFLDR